jgi:HlyD family secretion protein
METKNSFRKKILWIGSGLLLAAGMVWVFRPKPIEVDVSLVKEQDFIERIEADGVLRSKRRLIVPAFAMGEMGAVDLKVGDQVKKGQTITTLFWDLERSPLRSPITGVVSKVFRESAGPVQRGEAVIEVLDPHELEVAVEVLTLDASRIRSGNPAVIQGWGENGSIAAHVIRVSKAGFVKVSALGVEEERTEVVLGFDSGARALPKEWGSTFHVDVEIEVNRLSSQRVIPVGALVREGEGWMVWQLRAGRAHAQPVRVRAISGGLVALEPQSPGQEASLLPGESVILYPGDLIQKEIRVKARN